ncbi:MAG: hypothetical protein A2570_02630 [Candidatus Brennerbacteria bacterium RIFOXYD1_FULL_41_16]|uniref:Uncharacterized protein n=1 Tax=Candidatus Brennerbacteria bacterium RIFOXYD1_FULL_41_16 TaxID=1797529 RepID=A0A1G1XJF1_9BACT|nr:MAG: hypothetical protein A2570_02630 [Candidatus Brennerbacteria bacterium RIFOXYD1_FULL_41_16]
MANLQEQNLNKNKIVQTGPKIQFGGARVGFAKPTYQPDFIEGRVNQDPINPANLGMMSLKES